MFVGKHVEGITPVIDPQCAGSEASCQKCGPGGTEAGTAFGRPFNLFLCVLNVDAFPKIGHDLKRVPQRYLALQPIHWASRERFSVRHRVTGDYLFGRLRSANADSLVGPVSLGRYGRPQLLRGSQ